MRILPSLRGGSVGEKQRRLVSPLRLSGELTSTLSLKPLEDRTALVEVWWLSPGPFRAADRFPLGNSVTPPFGFPRSDTNRNH